MSLGETLLIILDQTYCYKDSETPLSLRIESDKVFATATEKLFRS